MKGFPGQGNGGRCLIQNALDQVFHFRATVLAFHDPVDEPDWFSLTGGHQIPCEEEFGCTR